ncbi:MAG TPA: DUF6510 family protein [Candidatus Dormibacteraeota bacterium]
MAGATRLDGNAVAGLLGEIFAAEMTLAQGTCGSCGSTGPMGEVHLYMDAPGAVLRCSSCEQVLMTVVRGPEHVWLNVAGLRLVRLATSGLPH